MDDKAKISVRQLSILVLMYTIGTSNIILPSRLTIIAKQDAWIAAILGVGFGLIIAFYFSSVGQYFKNKSLIEASKFAFGKWFGSIVSLPVIVYIFTSSCLILANVGDFVDSRMLINTPLGISETMYVLLIIFAVRLGIEPLSRTAEIFLPLFYIVLIILVGGVLPQIDTQRLEPVWEYGFTPILKASLLMISLPYSELIVILMLVPYLVNVKKLKSGVVTGTFLGGIILILAVLLPILVLGSLDTSHQIYAVFTVAKKIELGGFIERIEIIIGGIWIISIFVKLSVTFYALLVSLQHLLNLKEKNFLTFPLGMIIIPFSRWISPNTAVNLSIIPKKMDIFSYYILVIPLLVVVAAWLKNKIVKKPATN